MACSYFTCLIMMKHVPFLPNLYTTVCNDLRDLLDWRTCKLTFPIAGWRCWGWVYNKIWKWIPNGYVTHPVLTQPLHHCMTSFTYLSFCRLSLLGMGLQQPISKWILNEMVMALNSLYTNGHLSSFIRFFGEWINLPFRIVLRTVGFFENIPLQPYPYTLS
jgi:hypothetical protein